MPGITKESNAAASSKAVKKEVFSFLSKDGKTDIHAVKWMPPDGEVRAVLQVTHGMVEYIERYEEVAHYLAQRRFLVAGHDHLGHGASVNSEKDWGYFAKEKPSETAVADIYRLTRILRRQYPAYPYFILGHSMGSFLLRRYLVLHSGAVDGAILCGTGSQPDAAVRLGMLLCRLVGSLRGWHYRSRLLTQACFGRPYAQFDKTGKEVSKSWLSKNEESVTAYYKDARCTFTFTVNGYYGLFSTIYYDNRMKNIRKIRKNLPVLFIAGQDDPVGDFGRGVKKAYAQYRKAGIQDVKIKLYQNDRHEILQETDREQVFSDIFRWCCKHM